MSSASRKRTYRQARFPTKTGFQPPRKYYRFTVPRAVPRAGYASVARTRGAAVTGEMKYFDCELQGTAIAAVTTTWVAGTLQDPGTTINLGSAAVATPGCLFAPTVGAALNARIGRKVRMMKCRVNGIITIPVQAAQAAADTAAKIRIMLVMDNQTNAAAMTSAQLMNDGGAASTTINSFQNPNNFGRFRVLKEKIVTLSNMNLTGSPTAADVIQASAVRAWKMSYKFRQPVEVIFNATNGGTVADIVNSSLHIIVGASSIAFAPTVAYYSRVAYKE